MADPLQEVFANLDRWRHLPAYQLERRLDVFLTPYLKEVVETHLGTELATTIVPEMPLKQPGNNLTDKVDYVLFSRCGETAYLVELKTDIGSIRESQNAYLNRAVSRPWDETLTELVQVVQASQKRRKYIHLLRLLERCGQVRLAPELFECFTKGAVARFRAEWVEVTTNVKQRRVVFVTPTDVPGCCCIPFSRIHEYVERRDDVLSKLLARYLAAWSSEAGGTAPEADEFKVIE